MTRPAQRLAGPSPRVRGSPALVLETEEGRGSIPACAGKPVAGPSSPPFPRVHPRVCGEAISSVGPTGRGQGPSPRVRGSLRPVLLEGDRQGSIPACAGKPLATGWESPATRVHPRVCGEAVPMPDCRLATRGPSPRVRGSRRADRHRGHVHRSIPACAGKPRSGSRSSRTVAVHPRVCGEARRVSLLGVPAGGPSPRVRGSRRARQGDAGYGGSIPACAGKPLPSSASPPPSWVHPRVCGEASA